MATAVENLQKQNASIQEQNTTIQEQNAELNRYSLNAPSNISSFRICVIIIILCIIIFISELADLKADGALSEVCCALDRHISLRVGRPGLTVYELLDQQVDFSAVLQGTRWTPKSLSDAMKEFKDVHNAERYITEREKTAYKHDLREHTFLKTFEIFRDFYNSSQMGDVSDLVKLLYSLASASGTDRF